MAYDKRELFDERGFRCECGCGANAHDAHHVFIGRRKRFPELDCPENIVLVNHDEHILRKFDNRAWRVKFWKIQCDRYGKDHMEKWVLSLPPKLLLTERIDWLE